MRKSVLCLFFAMFCVFTYGQRSSLVGTWLSNTQKQRITKMVLNSNGTGYLERYEVNGWISASWTEHIPIQWQADGNYLTVTEKVFQLTVSSDGASPADLKYIKDYAIEYHRKESRYTDFYYSWPILELNDGYLQIQTGRGIEPSFVTPAKKKKMEEEAAKEERRRTQITEDYKRQIAEKYGDKYRVLSLSFKDGEIDKVYAECDKHGDFNINAVDFLANGCYKCHAEEEFLEKAKDFLVDGHTIKFRWSGWTPADYSFELEVHCPHYGDHPMEADGFLKYGCGRCAVVSMVNAELPEQLCGQYTFSEFNNDRFICSCPKHGSFSTNLRNMVDNGCESCIDEILAEKQKKALELSTLTKPLLKASNSTDAYDAYCGTIRDKKCTRVEKVAMMDELIAYKKAALEQLKTRNRIMDGDKALRKSCKSFKNVYAAYVSYFESLSLGWKADLSCGDFYETVEKNQKTLQRAIDEAKINKEFNNRVEIGTSLEEILKML